MSYYQSATFPKPTPRVLARLRRKKLDAKNARAVREITRKRDGGRCRIPGCMNSAAHLHHIVYRSKSKSAKFASSNNVWLCVKCHQAEHASLISIAGNADGKLIVTGDLDALKFRLRPAAEPVAEEHQ